MPLLLREPEKDVLIELTKGADLIAPHSVHWEIGNAFSSMLKQKRITLDLALKALDEYRKIPIRFVDVEMEETLKIVDKCGIYAYDAYILYSAQ